MYPGLFPNASHMKFSKLILAGILTLLSCSIREEREHCPCRLDMDLTAFSPYGRKALVALWDGLDASQEEVPVRDTLHRHVAKGIVGTSVWSGQREGQLSGSRLIVPAGSQPDSLQAFRAEVDCRGETAWVTAVPHKQYARVTLRVDIGPDTHYPYQFYVESDCCGIDLADLAPVPGELVFPVRQVASVSICCGTTPTRKYGSPSMTKRNGRTTCRSGNGCARRDMTGKQRTWPISCSTSTTSTSVSASSSETGKKEKRSA